MIREFDEARVAPVLDAVYDAAVTLDGWRIVLEELCALFNSHFADLFARKHDWTEFRGIAKGLDRADYDNEFLGIWCKRNVWAKAKPVRVAGEVLATWQMVDKQTVLKSEIYNGYLKRRALNEGLRLALWADEDWIQDISLIRPWSAGPFNAGELALGTYLLPHLQRAASLARRLGGISALDLLDRPAFLLDERGRLMRLNALADAMLAAAHGLLLGGGHLLAASALDQAALRTAIAAASGAHGQLPRASASTVSGPGGRRVHLDILPVRDRAEWALPGPRAVLVVATAPAAITGPSRNDLVARFGFTPAEADLALALRSGRSLAQAADESGRSIYTMRSHLARLMAKTRTRRQGELICVLTGAKSDLKRRSAPVMQMLGEIG